MHFFLIFLSKQNIIIPPLRGRLCYLILNKYKVEYEREYLWKYLYNDAPWLIMNLLWVLHLKLNACIISIFDVKCYSWIIISIIDEIMMVELSEF